MLPGALVTCAGDDASGGTEGETEGDSEGETEAADSSGGVVDPCGNGMMDAEEECDDGNKQNGDGCNNDCRPSAQTAWVQTFDSGGGTDCAEGIAADAEGNVIVAGFVATNSTGTDIWVAKYSPDGEQQWSTQIDGPASGDDRARGVDVGPNGEIFAVGFVAAGGASGDDIWIAELDGNGSEVWSTTHNGALEVSEDAAYDVVATPDGGLIVVGDEVVDLMDSQIWIRKLDGDGNEEWTQTYGGGGEALDGGRGIAVGPDGQILVTGWETKADGGRFLWVRQYASDGTETWTETYSAGNLNGNVGHGVGVDSTGQVTVTGSEREMGETPDIWTAAFSPSGGEPLWTGGFTSIAEGSDVGRGVAISSDDTAITAATFLNLGDVTEMRISKYLPDGTELWANNYGGSSKSEAEAFAVAVDPDDNVLVAGCQLNPGDISSGDIQIVKITP